MISIGLAGSSLARRQHAEWFPPWRQRAPRALRSNVQAAGNDPVRILFRLLVFGITNVASYDAGFMPAHAFSVCCGFTLTFA